MHPYSEAKIADGLAKQPELKAAHRARRHPQAKGKEGILDQFLLTKEELNLKRRTTLGQQKA